MFGFESEEAYDFFYEKICENGKHPTFIDGNGNILLSDLELLYDIICQTKKDIRKQISIEHQLKKIKPKKKPFLTPEERAKRKYLKADRRTMKQKLLPAGTDRRLKIDADRLCYHYPNQ